ncbi:MAG TPA: glycosyltransferase family 1 protein [Dongiaceae bacterium]
MDSGGDKLDGNPDIWVDVTTILRWNRPAVGVVRVEEQLARWILDHPTGSIRFCRYDQPLRTFEEVPSEDVVARLALYRQIAVNFAAASNANSAIPKQEKRIKRSKKTAKKILRRVTSKLRRAFKPALQRRFLNVLALHGALDTRTQAPPFNDIEETPPPIACIFRHGDVYVSVGADWDDNDLKKLYEYKQATQLKVIGICYDTIPIKFPHLTLEGVAQIFPKYLVDLAWACDHVMCISACTQRDFQEFVTSVGAPVPPTSVIVLGNNLSPTTAPVVDRASPEDAGRKFGLAADALRSQIADIVNNPFILFVSTIERRKNHETLYKAWARLIDAGCAVPNLVCVGMRGWGVGDLLADMSRDPRVQGRIHILPNVSDAELACLYELCQFTVYPSIYEGWGLPVAESLGFGKFCLCSNAGSLMEAGGMFAEYLDPWDVPAWIERIRFFSQNPAEIEILNQRAAMHFKAQSWSDTSAAIVERARTLVR